MSLKQNVYDLLIEKPITRDFDHKLIAYYWATYNGATRDTLAMMLLEGKLTSAESIRRYRQSIQEEFPHLRGKSYKERKKKEQQVRDEHRKDKAA